MAFLTVHFSRDHRSRPEVRVAFAALLILLFGLLGAADAFGQEDRNGKEDEISLPELDEDFSLDKVPNQVQIEALIVEARTSVGTELYADSAYMRLVRGIERSGSIQRAGITTSQVATGDLVTVPTANLPAEPDGEPGSLRDAAGFDADFDAGERSAGAQVLPGLIASFDVIEGDWGTFYLDLRMLLTEGFAEIVSRPVVLVVEGTPAQIHAGTEVPYQSIEYKSPTNLELNVTWKPVGVKLEVTPTIEPPDRIKLDIEDVSVSSLLRYENIRGVEMPLFQSREESTVAYVRDGSTLVFGGLVADTTRVSQTKVPLLGDIPLLGFLFRGTSNVRERTDLYIIMRPTIIKPGEPAILHGFKHLDEAVTKTETILSHPQ